MQLKDVSGWDSCSELEGYLFFAQRMDELLFQYSLDSYKPSCLNSVFLVKEALEVALEVEKELIDISSLKSVMDELKFSLSKDSIVKSMLSEGYECYILDVDNSKLKDVRVRLSILYNKISPGKYLYKCLCDLHEAICSKSKKVINDLSGKAVTNLINMGVSRSHLSELVNENFFSSNKIAKVIEQEEFVKLFFPKVGFYDVCINVSKLMRQVGDFSSAFEAAFFEDMESFISGAGYDPCLKLNKNKIFVLIKGVKASDIYSAAYVAESRVEKMANLYAVFHHKQKIYWYKKVSVKDEDGKVRVIDTQNNPIKNGFDLPPFKAAKALNEVIGSMKLSTDESFFKFDNVVDLHALASKSDSHSSQLLSIWTSLETLTPPSSSQSKISNIIQRIKPFLMLNYTTRLVRRFKGDLYGWSSKEYRRVLKRIDGTKTDGVYHKITKLIMLDEYEYLRNELYGKLDEFPLLRYRLFTLNEAFSSPKKLQGLLDNHCKRVEWQIRRLYRTRNMIVHAGQQPAYIGGLVENGHDYLDQILNEVMLLAAKTHECTTINQCYTYIDIKYKEYVRVLSKIDTFDQDNYRCAYREWT